MKTNILPALKLTLVLIVLLCGGYTLLIRAICLLAPAQGNGETVTANNKVVGYALIGQKFDQDKYFWSRPSAVNYNAAGSGGSNKGPSNPEYLASVQANIDTFIKHNPTVQKGDIPSDLVTASGSGQDPDISVQGALVQVDRVAKARGLDAAQVRSLVEAHTDKPLLGLGPEKVNILKLNIDLDGLKK
jgi:K+-transporting ATPase ATPase C chain